jgi:murein L,D-transpeptidase YafK
MVRALLAPAAVAAAIALAGCNADDITPTGRAMAPLSEQTKALIESKNMDKYSPILIRIFKQEAEMEVWKQTRDGTYALLKTYPICRWSGDLGPKKRQGDRQAPEGFYTITPGQMNPNSNYYLAFNTGFPNAYDRSHGYTGSELMVHGDCSSRGCYAMTDKQILEIYAMARDSFFGGQKEFQFEAFPFRMTALNMAKHRNNPNFAFWKMLKQGYDDFEATHQEPKVDVCDRHYIFDAASPANSSRPLVFNPRGKCPVYRLDPTIAQAVLDYRRQQQVKMASYIAEGVATAPPHVGDGGTNPVFAQALMGPRYGDNNTAFEVASANWVPGALPHVPNPPGTTIPHALPQAVAAVAADKAPPAEPPSEQLAMTEVPMPTPAPLPKVGEAPPQPTTVASLFGNLFHATQTRTQAEAAPVAPAPSETVSEPAANVAPVQLRGSTTQVAAKPAHREKVRTASTSVTHQPKPQKATPPKRVAEAHNIWEPAREKSVKQAKKIEKPPVKQVAKREEPPQQAPVIRTAFSAPPASSNGLLAGAQPVMPAGSFTIR